MPHRFMSQSSAVSSQPVSNPPDGPASQPDQHQAADRHQQPAIESPAGGTRKQNHLPPGYPALAARMGLFPEKAIFRRFGFLNKLNILYLQAELMEIEDQLKCLQGTDSLKDGDEKFYATDWYCLNQGDNEQLKLMLHARDKLDKYNTAIIQQSYILSMKTPGKSDLDYIQKFLASEDMGPCALDGLDSEVWGTIKDPKGYEPDIITLAPRTEEDMFSNLLAEKGMSAWFKYGLDRFRKPSPVHGQVAYEESALLRLTYLFATALASLLPIASIVVLCYVRSMEARLGFIALFNVLTSFCLAFFTTAKRTDIFAVAAAFSAVQVVFVQGDGGGSSMRG
ncbi:uncharacterized protein BKCO1_4700067 [Diplodia corticola]|uniref:DUF6594 domain-containing protein n=1 Tax=Diplodia corticola TaxID=236234 RepID=A0A1J9QU42_9PEZI|nr:uncharacterized protein BKCO1_4700067 [Diplodia corticola]OJD31506.1 hypothetical protein BKCO1_4700067 [Diplodia corticola]